MSTENDVNSTIREILGVPCQAIKRPVRLKEPGSYLMNPRSYEVRVELPDPSLLPRLSERLNHFLETDAREKDAEKMFHSEPVSLPEGTGLRFRLVDEWDMNVKRMLDEQAKLQGYLEENWKSLRKNWKGEDAPGDRPVQTWKTSRLEPDKLASTLLRVRYSKGVKYLYQAVAGIEPPDEEKRNKPSHADRFTAAASMPPEDFQR